MRVGHGYDVHALVEGRDLILGGVKIPHHKGLQGHSDADVLIHAICDALLGAAALGDIGRHFPDADAQFKNIDSRILLRHVREMLEDNGYGVGNVDATIIAQAPKLAGFIPKMVEYLADDLCVEQSQVNVKATTTEKLGFIGREEGIAVEAVALIRAK
ncbi:MAG: 2-C-methyl-D-erythritol 2,4-cyclodiphosphate synthase [Acidiferrobacterales bacterium]|nr:2-C-methyl-D-erythritol 2,4-cyclodiphosphate synthase [Acidiferrobacterales bacterium]